jgi:hypothetical protein
VERIKKEGESKMSKVICNQAAVCLEYLCGAKSPHYYDEHECGKCPRLEQECEEIEEKEDV